MFSGFVYVFYVYFGSNFSLCVILQFPGDKSGHLEDLGLQPVDPNDVRREQIQPPKPNQQNHRTSLVLLLENDMDGDVEMDNKLIDLNTRPSRIHGQPSTNQVFFDSGHVQPCVENVCITFIMIVCFDVLIILSLRIILLFSYFRKGVWMFLVEQIMNLQVQFPLRPLKGSLKNDLGKFYILVSLDHISHLLRFLCWESSNYDFQFLLFCQEKI